jgi:hypothetical protein
MSETGTLRPPAGVVANSALAAVLASGNRDLVTFSPLIVRGLEYYTATVFEVFDTDPANSRSLFGGSWGTSSGARPSRGPRSPGCCRTEPRVIAGSPPRSTPTQRQAPGRSPRR